MATTTLSNRVDPLLKREFELTAESIGISTTSALTVFMKRFVADGGFPFDVVAHVPSEREYAAEMDARLARMVAGNETEHNLIEV